MASTYTVGQQPVPGYRLVRFLGRGGFGEVWEASAPGGACAALKMIALEGRPGLKELKAIRLMKRIGHPNLVPIHALWLRDQHGQLMDNSLAESPLELGGLGPSGGSLGLEALHATQPGHPVELIMAMGLGQRSLWDRLEDCQRQGLTGLPPDELIPCLEDAARALDFLNARRHDLGSGLVSIQHCDVKPQNILQVGDSVQVCDFGLARVLGENSARLSIAGTLNGMGFSAAYAAPETLDERGPSSGTDQYSLAITYFELRTGRLPFRSLTPAAILDTHCRGGLTLECLPPAEQQVLRRATSLSPVQRFPNCTEMIRALAGALGQGTSLRSGGLLPPASPHDDGVFNLSRIVSKDEAETPLNLNRSQSDLVLDAEDSPPAAATPKEPLTADDMNIAMTRVKPTEDQSHRETPSTSSAETSLPPGVMAGQPSRLCTAGFQIAPGCRLDRMIGGQGRDAAWRAVGDAPGREVLLLIRDLTPETAIYVDAPLLETLRGVPLRHPHVFTVRTFWLLDSAGRSIEQDFRTTLSSGRAAKLILGGRYCEDNLLLRLQKIHTQGTGLGPAEALHYTRQIATAVDFLNAKRHVHQGRVVGIQHQGVTLFNCWFTSDGTLRLANPAQSRALGESHWSLRGPGDRPDHELVAPEVEAGWLSSASDQFTLALLYVQLRVGLLPWQARDLRAQLLAHVRSPQPGLASLLPFEAEAVSRATADDPQERYANCLDFTAALSTASTDAALSGMSQL